MGKDDLNRKEVKQILKDTFYGEGTLESVKKARVLLKPYIRDEGVKYDNEKLRYDLLPIDALEELVKVFTMGSKKYAERNWEKGMSWGKIFAALLRHLFAFWMGENVDKESGYLHTAYVTWNAMALLTYQKRKIGLDDRVKGE